MDKAIIITGPTATGKSEIGVSLAKDIGEIISADSMQIYKLMDTATAKPTSDLLRQVPHHLVDFLHPNEAYNVYKFFSDCETLMSEINIRAKIPFIVGGTGLYIKALINGIFPVKISDEKIRLELKSQVKTHGVEYLYQKLIEEDPAAAQKINQNDKFRIVRALEVKYASGTPISEWQQKNKNLPYRFLKIGITQPREKLYEIIEERCHKMLEEGLIEETKSLLDEGINPECQAMKALGYRHALQYLYGKISEDEMITLFLRDTRRFAKRQLILFRGIKDIRWFYPEEIDNIRICLNEFLYSADNQVA